MDRKVLLIDDSAILRRIATNVLDARTGTSEVVTATRATEGFARACAGDVGLILVDYQIAGWPGAELCVRLLAEPRTRRVPVVLLVTPSMAAPARENLPANVVDVLTKPFTPDQLVRVVKDVFGREHSEPKGNEATVPTGKTSYDAGHRQQRVTTSLVRETTVINGRYGVGIRHETGGSHHARPAARVLSHPQTGGVRPTVARRHNLEPYRLRQALAAAAARGETGVLRVRMENRPATEIYLENGEIVFLTTRDARRYASDASGAVPSKVSAAMLDSAVATQAESGVPLFLTLGSRGLLSKTTAISLLHRFGQRYLVHLWTLPADEMSFEFTTLDALPGFALRLEPRRESVNDWLLASLRLLQPENVADAARSEGFAGAPSYRENGAETATLLGLHEQERAFARLVDGRRDLASVAKQLGIGVEQAYLILFRFRCLGIMDYRPKSAAFVVTPRTSVRRVLPLPR